MCELSIGEAELHRYARADDSKQCGVHCPEMSIGPNYNTARVWRIANRIDGVAGCYADDCSNGSGYKKFHG